MMWLADAACPPLTAALPNRCSASCRTRAPRQVFHCSRSVFAATKRWRQLEAKKAAGLF